MILEVGKRYQDFAGSYLVLSVYIGMVMYITIDLNYPPYVSSTSHTILIDCNPKEL